MTEKEKREDGVWKDLARMEAEVIDPGESVTVEVPRDVIDDAIPPSLPPSLPPSMPPSMPPSLPPSIDSQREVDTNRWSRQQVDGILESLPKSDSAKAVGPSAFGPQHTSPLATAPESSPLPLIIVALLLAAAACLAFLML